MTALTPGANAPLPPASQVSLQLRTARAHADLIVLCVRGDGTADGDNGVALWTQPQAAGGSVRIDTATDTVTLDLGRIPADVQRLLVVAQADGVADLAAAGSLTAAVRADGADAVTLQVDAPPALPTVQVGEVYRHTSGWKVRCLGDGYQDGLKRLLEVHGIEVDDDEPAPAAAPPAAAPPADPVDFEKKRRVDLIKKVQATGSVSLVKKVEAAAVSLDKHGLTGVRAEVIMVLDVSGSAKPLFRHGYVELVTRALGAALLFDDDGTIPAYLFDTRLHDAPDVTLDNFETWCADVNRRTDIWGGTRYAPPIEKISADVPRGKRVPTYVLFITDGGNSDRQATATAITQAAGKPIFWKFSAVGNEDAFPFLQKLDDLTGREIDNADFFAFPDPLAVSDEAFYEKMMQEFQGWISQAKAKGILG